MSLGRVLVCRDQRFLALIIFLGGVYVYLYRAEVDDFCVSNFIVGEHSLQKEEGGSQLSHHPADWRV